MKAGRSWARARNIERRNKYSKMGRRDENSWLAKKAMHTRSYLGCCFFLFFLLLIFTFSMAMTVAAHNAVPSRTVCRWRSVGVTLMEWVGMVNTREANALAKKEVSPYLSAKVSNGIVEKCTEKSRDSVRSWVILRVFFLNEWVSEIFSFH